MMANRLLPLLFIVFTALLIVMMSACGTYATPQTPVMAPALAQYIPTPVIAIDPSSAQTGRWLWRTFTTEAEAYPPVQLWMDVAEGGSVSGMLSIYPNNPEIPQSALTLIQQNGCNITFESLEAEGISGVIASPTDAYFQVNVTACTVKFYGDVALDAPLTGEFTMSYDEAVTLALLNPEPPTPLERGRSLFSMYCSACHGTYGEGAPGIPSLATDDVRNRTDDELLQIVTNGVINTVMPAWGNVLTPEDLQAVLLLVRNIEILDS